ncbi:MAG TPA: hypothetical protein VJ801_14370 [Polyangia bacterium]|jgi:hypothetical protein|nr:hypothetical protein [Polyangia bacterium]
MSSEYDKARLICYDFEAVARMIWVRDDLRRQLTEANAAREKAEAKVHDWNRQAARVLAGSEYFDDPKRVFDDVLERQSSMNQTIIENVRKRHEAEADNAVLHANATKLEADYDALEAKVAALAEALEPALRRLEIDPTTESQESAWSEAGAR